MANNFLHTWELDEKSWLIRFYMFWYLTDEHSFSQLSFCKLFWAVVCAPLMGLVWAFYFTGLSIYKLFKHFQARAQSKPKPTRTNTNAQSKRKATVVAESVGSFFDRVSAFLQRHEWIGTVIGWSALIVGGLAALGGTTYGTVRLVALIHGNLYWHIWWQILKTVFWFFIGASIWLLLAFGVGDGGKGFRPWARIIGRFLATGYHAVKYRTCPRVVVVKRDYSTVNDILLKYQNERNN